MDDLKRLLEDTESIELPVGHEKRFEDKLGTLGHHWFFMPQRVMYVSVAASIAIIVCLFAFFDIGDITKPNKLVFAQDEIELFETEVFLQQTIYLKLEEINSMDIKANKKMILKDISEIDKTLEVLKRDYKKAPGDSRIINAVIITYMKKIEALDNIKNILQKHS